MQFFLIINNTLEFIFELGYLQLLFKVDCKLQILPELHIAKVIGKYSIFLIWIEFLKLPYKFIWITVFLFYIIAFVINFFSTRIFYSKILCLKIWCFTFYPIFNCGTILILYFLSFNIFFKSSKSFSVNLLSSIKFNNIFLAAPLYTLLIKELLSCLTHSFSLNRG